MAGNTTIGAGIGWPAARQRAGVVAAPAAAGAARIDWLDTTRGIGIVLVVIGHALGGLIDSPLGGGLLAFRDAFFAIYTFHMPLFFVLAGLLVERRLERGPKPFVARLGAAIVWPYFLWSTLQFAAIYAAGSLVNRPAGAFWPTIAALPWKPVSQFWFLYALFWSHLIAAAVLPRFGRNALLVLAGVAKLVVVLVALPPAIKLIAGNLVWYALGVWLGPDRLAALVVRRPAWVRGGLLPAIAAATIWLTLRATPGYAPDLPIIGAASPEIANVAWRLPALPAALIGLAATAGLASLAAGRAGEALATLGRQTMPIFLLHVLWIAGARILLIRLGLVDLRVLLPLLVVLGLTGPVIAARLLRAGGLGARLGL